MDTKHSPTPWFIATDPDTGDRIIVDSTAGGLVIARRMSAEDAVYIIHAVNAHEELLAFAKLVADATLLAPEWNEKAKRASAEAEGE